MTLRNIKLVLFLIGIALITRLGAQNVTDGSNTFEAGDGDVVFSKGKLALDHVKALKGDTLIVKLNSDDKKISYLRKRGKNKQADVFQKKVDLRNEQMISSFKESFTFCKVLFYHSKDSDALLKERDYSKLFDSEMKPFEGKTFENPPYFLFYGSVPHIQWNNEKFYVLYSWDFEKVTRIDRLYFPKSGNRKFKKMSIPELTAYTNKKLTGISNKK